MAQSSHSGVPPPGPSPSSVRKYKLEFHEDALEEWHRLDGSVKENFRNLLRSRLDQPHVPGSELKGQLKGYYKIKLRAQGYRLVYSVRDDVMVVTVIVVDKREDENVYRSAIRRLLDMEKQSGGKGTRTVSKRQLSRFKW